MQALTARGWDYAIVIDTPAPEEPQFGCPSTDEEMPDVDTYDFCIELPEEALPDAARRPLGALP